jgi:ribosomal protein L34
VSKVEADDGAKAFIADAGTAGVINIIANRPGAGDLAEYEEKLAEARDTHHLTADDPVLFLEVQPGDASEFTEVLQVTGQHKHGFRVLRCRTHQGRHGLIDDRHRCRAACAEAGRIRAGQRDGMGAHHWMEDHRDHPADCSHD